MEKKLFLAIYFLIGLTVSKGAVLWSSSNTIGQYWNGAGITGLLAETVDWGTLSSNVFVNQFTIGYATDSTDDVQMRISFYNGNTIGGHEPVAASFDLTLPGSSDGSFQAFFETISLTPAQAFTLNAGGFEYGYQYLSMGNGTGLGPLLTAEDLVNAPGTVDIVTTVNGSYWDEYDPGVGQAGSGTGWTNWFGDPAVGAPYAQFFMEIEGIPEPSAILLSAAGLMFVCFRRNRLRQA